MYDDELFGKTGVHLVEVNSRRKSVRTVDHTDSIPGEDIQLTINLELQREVYGILSEYESGSCVIMDVNTGAVLAFVSYPGYDTNIFTRKVDGAALKELYENPHKPMINKVISGLYAPGSVFKMIVALAGLHYGVINKHTRFNCSGVHELGSHKFHCWKWKYGGHGSVDLVDAIAESCDIYFYNVAMLLGPDRIAKVANDFGLGIPTGIDLPHEKSGLIPTKAWKKQKKKQSWTKGDSLNMAIGQGFNLATPLQLARMISILVNGLRPVIPHLRAGKQPPLGDQLEYKKEHIELIMEGMDAAVNSETGTARASAIDDEDFQMGGKTGSSQVYRITEEQRKLGKTVSDDYWLKEHSVFVGYAPVDSPKFAVSVLIEHGGGGAKVATPIAREILLATRKYMKE
jgi:penicillin-binding protein 2